MLKIEKNIPVQPKRESNNTRVVREMSFGDSVFFPKDKLIYKNQGTRWYPVNVDSFYKLLQKKAKKINGKVISRRIKDKNNNLSGFRVWLLDKNA